MQNMCLLYPSPYVLLQKYHKNVINKHIRYYSYSFLLSSFSFFCVCASVLCSILLNHIFIVMSLYSKKKKNFWVSSILSTIGLHDMEEVKNENKTKREEEEVNFLFDINEHFILWMCLRTMHIWFELMSYLIRTKNILSSKIHSFHLNLSNLFNFSFIFSPCDFKWLLIHYALF